MVFFSAVLSKLVTEAYILYQFCTLKLWMFAGMMQYSFLNMTFAVNKAEAIHLVAHGFFKCGQLIPILFFDSASKTKKIRILAVSKKNFQRGDAVFSELDSIAFLSLNCTQSYLNTASWK